MNRRKFIKSATAAGASVPFILNGVSVKAMSQSSLFSGVNPESDKILVLIQMNGGNDGLSTFTPMDQYSNLTQVRSNILIPENKLIKLTDTISAHPKVQGMANLFHEGKMGIIQSVGYPDQNRSHFRSSDIWTSGSPSNEFWDNGWLGRYFDTLYGDYPVGYPNANTPHPFAIAMGSGVSETCQGSISNYSLSLSDPFSLSPILEGEEGAIPSTPYGDELEFMRIAIKQSNAYGEEITNIAEQGTSTATYPEDNNLANQLKNIALLISGGMQTNVYVVSLGGFDTHSEQVDSSDVSEGNHAILLDRVSQAVEAFQIDLANQGLEDRVISLAFSEFGRRIKSNGSLGTDHGTAVPLMLFGTCIDTQVLGDNPEIDPNVAVKEGVPMQYDFRDVYGSILMDWFDVEEDVVKTLLHQDFIHLPILRNCLVSNEEESFEINEYKVYPNPFANNLSIDFTSNNDHVRVDVYDVLGALVQNISNRKFSIGSHTIKSDLHNLSNGIYFIRLQVNNTVKMKRVVKS